MYFPTFIAAFLIGSSALTAGTPVESPSDNGIVDTSPEGTLAAAAALSIDLSKLPAWEAIPALNLTPIKTGEGLPTLQDLKLTWADLVKPVETLTREPAGRRSSSNSARSNLQRRFDNRCYGPFPISYADADACYYYLLNLGSTPCGVPPVGHEVVFCESNSSQWRGHSVNSSPQSSWCYHVAQGGRWILDTCTFWFFGWHHGSGEAAAYGNGDLVVRVI